MAKVFTTDKETALDWVNYHFLAEDTGDIEDVKEVRSLSNLDIKNKALFYLSENIHVFENLDSLSFESYEPGLIIETIPDSVCNLNNLVILNFMGVGLKTLPNNIGKLESLIELRIDRNEIKKLPNSIGKLKNLDVFICNNNKIQELPKSMNKLKKLSCLNIGNNLIEEIPLCFEELNNLLYFFIYFNNIKEYPYVIEKMESIKIFTFDDNLLNVPKKYDQYIKIDHNVCYLDINEYNKENNQ